MAEGPKHNLLVAIPAYLLFFTGVLTMALATVAALPFFLLFVALKAAFVLLIAPRAEGTKTDAGQAPE